MLPRSSSQILLLVALCSVLCSRTLSLPALGTYSSMSNDLLEDPMPVKRHSDAIFTDNYSRFRKQMAVKKYLNSVLTGKRSQEDINPPSLQDEATVSEPSFQESYDDVTVDELLNHLPLVGGIAI
ncbi:VIP protein, partial [Amia calva]|nr:VIP protein [Amia calva]